MMNPEGTVSAATHYPWIRRQLSDSIYVWACGEKADDEDEDPKLSDRLIGWLILFMQAFAYTMLVILARSTSNLGARSSADGSRESGYLLPSVVGAMYLLVASTTHDLRSGFSLVVDGERAGHRAFGIGLLIVYGIMIGAAMTVLVSTSNDSASVVLNAVTVLFIADMDEKALKFLLTVPQKWRLFWAIQSVGMSLALALLAVAYMGDASPLLQGSYSLVNKGIPDWGLWVVSPAAITWCSFRLSTTLQAVCQYIEAGDSTNTSPGRCFFSRALARVRAAVKGTRESLRAEPCFDVVLAVWFLQGVASWWYLGGVIGLPLAFTFALNESSSDEYRVVITHNKYALVTLNMVLIVGLALKMLCVLLTRHGRVSAVTKPRLCAARDVSADVQSNCAASRVPSLLVGWGLGYWVSSLLYVLAVSWHGTAWTNAPIVLTCIGYVILPCFLLAGVVIVADEKFLGRRFGAFVKPAVDTLKNRRLVTYWVLATVLRDVVNVWIIFCFALKLGP